MIDDVEVSINEFRKKATHVEIRPEEDLLRSTVKDKVKTSYGEKEIEQRIIANFPIRFRYAQETGETPTRIFLSTYRGADELLTLLRSHHSLKDKQLFIEYWRNNSNQWMKETYPTLRNETLFFMIDENRISINNLYNHASHAVNRLIDPRDR